MLRLKYLTASCLLALMVSGANATTFDWSLSGNPAFGITGSGTLTANESGGQFVVDSISGSVSDSCAGVPCLPQFRSIIGLLTPHQAYGGLSDIGGDNLIFPTGLPAFVDNQGLVFAIGECPFSSGCYMWIFYASNGQTDLYMSNAVANGVDFVLSAEFGVTPLPAALPLFASGLGAMGFIGWRRKRKAIAA